MSNTDNEIAIIGLAGRFPGAANADEFWRKLRNGEELITFFNDEEAERPDPDNPKLVKAGGVLADIELFDAEFFNISPREAQLMDPQQRVFLECCWNAIENAGYDVDTYNGAVALYAGVSVNTYALSLFPTLQDPANLFQALIASDKDFLATRVSYKLNLSGESVTVQTACSTSLVAIHMACQSLLTGQCDMALAGGVTIVVPQKAGYVYQEGVINSPDGHCRAFDARAKGTVRGNGAGVVVLKLLSDAIRDGDHVHAVIKGSAVNNDGHRKVGFTAPSVAGQADVIMKAQAMAGVEPETIGYIEAHGTGTPLGDPIEIEALTRAFREGTDRKQFCAIGSVKTNIGHLDSAAGVAGLIKAVHALKHKEIPPSLHFETPNPEIDFANSPFYVSTALHELKSGDTPRRAGVSSFGIGGTNAHIVLEEAPGLTSEASHRPYQVLTFSARTPDALEQMLAELAEHLQANPAIDLADVAYTRNIGRRTFSCKRAVVAKDGSDCVEQLLTKAKSSARSQRVDAPGIVMMFPGQGVQLAGAARGLYEHEMVFREQIDRCAEWLRYFLKLDLRELLYPPEHCVDEANEQLQQTRLTQPALFVTEYALAQLWMSWGLKPQAMIGHSLGEYVAACLSGVFSLEDALCLVAFRGNLMQQSQPGRMVAVGISEADCREFLTGMLSLAAINGKANCVISGPTNEIERLTEMLATRGIAHRYLQTSRAFHSALVDPVLDEFTAIVAGITRQAPNIPYISSLTGRLIEFDEVADPLYWSRQMRQTVRFAAGLDALRERKHTVFLEVGPGHSLTGLARRHFEGSDLLIAPSLNQREDYSVLLDTLGKLWIEGVAVDWSGFYRDEQRRRVPLPTYPFERKRHWIEVQRKPADKIVMEACPFTASVATAAVRENGHLEKTDAAQTEIEKNVAGIWTSSLGLKEIGMHDNFFELGGDSLIAAQIYARLKQAFPVDLSLEDLLTSQTIAELASVIENKLEQTTPGYYCAFELEVGDSKVAIKMTEEEFHQRGIPEAALNLQFL